MVFLQIELQGVVDNLLLTVWLVHENELWMEQAFPTLFPYLWLVQFCIVTSYSQKYGDRGWLAPSSGVVKINVDASFPVGADFFSSEAMAVLFGV